MTFNCQVHWCENAEVFLNSSLVNFRKNQTCTISVEQDRINLYFSFFFLMASQSSPLKFVVKIL